MICYSLLGSTLRLFYWFGSVLLFFSRPATPCHPLLHHLSAVEVAASSFLGHHFSHHLGKVHTLTAVEEFFLSIFLLAIHHYFSFESLQFEDELFEILGYFISVTTIKRWTIIGSFDSLATNEAKTMQVG